MELRRLNLMLLGINIVLFIVAILVLIKVLFSGFKGFEWGSVSDWFSAIANIIIAGAAVYAALQARKWFKQKKYELAHSLARDLTFTLYETQNILEKFEQHVTTFTVSASTKKDMAKISYYVEKICELISKKERGLFDLKR
ncbi:hypothetical protein ACQ3G4_22690 [bacterium BS0013]